MTAPSNMQYLDEQGVIVEEVLETESIIEAPMEEVLDLFDEGNIEEGPVEVSIVELEYVIEEQIEGSGTHDRDPRGRVRRAHRGGPRLGTA